MYSAFAQSWTLRVPLDASFFQLAVGLFMLALSWPVKLCILVHLGAFSPYFMQPFVLSKCCRVVIWYKCARARMVQVAILSLWDQEVSHIYNIQVSWKTCELTLMNIDTLLSSSAIVYVAVHIINPQPTCKKTTCWSSHCLRSSDNNLVNQTFFSVNS